MLVEDHGVEAEAGARPKMLKGSMAAMDVNVASLPRSSNRSKPPEAVKVVHASSRLNNCSAAFIATSGGVSFHDGSCDLCVRECAPKSSIRSVASRDMLFMGLKPPVQPNPEVVDCKSASAIVGRGRRANRSPPLLLPSPNSAASSRRPCAYRLWRTPPDPCFDAWRLHVFSACCVWSSACVGAGGATRRGGFGFRSSPAFM
mmetsp:Transcript_114857/g.331902  ORF Transcript_114857/g.331902 Transcript_114857/m.331902 type:complete len:202 (+) Transcript_114857:1154-1759(+)